ncbi:MAG: Gp15 family bacteriophage protein [Ruminococcus sp.]|nr:Gp15 family bacteriophage protein [Ruminococcus sp.]
MTGYELPTSLSIGGVDFSIRTDFRAILDILIACNDPELDDYEKTEVMLDILYEEAGSIPPELLEEACAKACEFIDCGNKEDSTKNIKLIDWEQDAGMIMPAVNSVAHMEIRALEYLHWWSFMGFFMGIGESLLSNVISIREKKAKHKKLEPYEKDFYKENKSIIDFKTHISDEEQKIKDSLNKWL